MAQLEQVDVRTAPLNTQREDVMQNIVDVSVIPLPFLDLIGRETHDNQFYEWLCDRLAAPDVDNAAIDGQDAPAAEGARAIRLGNNSQIFLKAVGVSTRFESSNIAGNLKLAQNIQKKTQENWRDINARLLYNAPNVADTGTGGVAGETAGLECWVDPDEADETGTVKAPVPYDDVSTGGIGIGGWSNRTGGTIVPAVDYSAVTAKGAVSFSGVMDVLAALYQLGTNPSVLLARPTVLRRLSSYMFTSGAQIASLIRNADEIAAAKAINAVNTIVTDNGVVVDFVADRLMQQSAGPVAVPLIDTMFAFDPQYLKFSTQGGGMRVRELPHAGLGRKSMIWCDGGLSVTNPDALGAVFGIDDTEAAVA